MARKIKKRRKKNYFNVILKDNKFLLVFIIIIIVALVRIFVPILSRKHMLEQRKTLIENEIESLNNKISEMTIEVQKLQKDKVYIEKIAREQLGLARDNEIIYNIVEFKNVEHMKEGGK